MTRSAQQPAEIETANDRFKRGFASWFWIGLFTATLLHALFFYAAPTFRTQDLRFAASELSVLDLPTEIEIPPPPEAVPRPAAPVITVQPTLDEDITIAPTTFESNPVERLPPPRQPERVAPELAAAPIFTPMTVRPTLTNAGEVASALQANYPPALRDAGIGGTVTVWFFIDESGRVVRTLVNQPSGYDAFDDAALRVADVMRFTPAYNLDQRVQVWVSIAITFQTDM